MQELKALEGKSLAELREIAKALGIKNVCLLYTSDAADE